MSVDRTLQEWARDRAEELPGAYLDHPFGEEWDVFKVRGKVFMLHTVLDDDPVVTLKARPEDATVLRQAYPQIARGYHMNKKHWITVHPGGDLDRQAVEDLVTESYLLVIEKNVPRTQWPVNPQTFGQAAGNFEEAAPPPA